MMMRAAIAGLVFSGLSGLAPLAAGQVVVLPGTVNTAIRSVSDDGTSVVGDRTGPVNFFWSAASGVVDLSHPIIAQTPLPLLSGDGTSMLAISRQTGTRGQPFLATPAGEYTFLPRPFSVPAQAFPTGISRDGSVVSGWDETNQNTTQVGWRWSASGGMQLLPFLALAMSGDGNTIFGSYPGGSAVWRSGVTTPMPAGSGSVAVVNYDGTVYGGFSPLGMTLWRNEVATGIPLLPGMALARFTDVNDDGSVVVGTMSDGTALNVPFIWTPSGGTQPLGAYFASYGYDLSGYDLWDVHLSSDGRTFGVSGVSRTDGISDGILVTIPSPSVAMSVVVGLALGHRRRR